MANWTVKFKNSKVIQGLPNNLKPRLIALIRQLEEFGPVRGNLPNYSKLGKDRHHGHLKKGRPTYVVVWKVIDQNNKIIEIEYIGTHEKAPY